MQNDLTPDGLGKEFAADDGPADAADEKLGRTQRRHLRRIFHGRSKPVLIDDQKLLTYQQVKQFLATRAPDQRDAAYERIKSLAK